MLSLLLECQEPPFPWGARTAIYPRARPSCQEESALLAESQNKKTLRRYPEGTAKGLRVRPSFGHVLPKQAPALPTFARRDTTRPARFAVSGKLPAARFDWPTPTSTNPVASVRPSRWTKSTSCRDRLPLLCTEANDNLGQKLAGFFGHESKAARQPATYAVPAKSVSDHDWYRQPERYWIPKSWRFAICPGGSNSGRGLELCLPQSSVCGFREPRRPQDEGRGVAAGRGLPCQETANGSGEANWVYEGRPASFPWLGRIWRNRAPLTYHPSPQGRHQTISARIRMSPQASLGTVNTTLPGSTVK